MTLDRLALVVWDTKWNRHSTNALIAALETDPAFDRLELRIARSESDILKSLSDLLSSGKRPVMVLSFASPKLAEVREMLGRLRAAELGPSRSTIRWLAGGPHPTADPDGTLALGFDHVVVGEGESVFLELIQTLAENRDAPAVWQGNRPVDLDAFGPFPLRRRMVVGPIEIARGCPFACAFCQTPGLFGRAQRHRGIGRIARYARAIREQDLRDVRFISPDAFSYGSTDGRSVDLAALESLLSSVREAIGPEGRLFFGTFPSEVRPEHVQPAALELLKRFANNDNLIIGAQSGSDRSLRRCGRGHTVADIFAAVSNTLAAGLKPRLDFIFGLPGDDADDEAETIRTVRELAAMGAAVNAHSFLPLPGTRWSTAPPGRITPAILRLLGDLGRDGALFGAWRNQERQAGEMGR